ncbi:MAG: conjugal transfer nickase/helicase domain-containing protein [Gammaproteobacteria bacterium]
MKTPKYSFRLGRSDDDSFVYDRVHSVLSADELLSVGERNDSVDQVRRQSGAPPEYFNTLYLQLIESYAQFVQNIPSLKSRRLSWLDRQLALASTLIVLREPYVLAGEILNRVTDNEKSLWNYVMFTGMLLSRVGDLISQYDISLCSESGVPTCKWDPLIGGLDYQGEYYRINKIGGETQTFAGYHLTIASRLMPPDGLYWIMSNPDAFEQWVLMLNGEGEYEHPTLFYAALAFLEEWLEHQLQTVEKHPDEHPEIHPQEEIDNLLDRFLRKTSNDRWEMIQTQLATERALGEQFLIWLRKGIANNTIAINKANSAIFMTREGVLLINPAIFNKFKAEHRLYSKRDVLRAFMHLPMMAQSKMQRYKSQFPGDASHQLEGLIVKNPKALFAKEIPTQTEYVVKAQSSYRRSEQMIATYQKEAEKQVRAQDQTKIDKAKEEAQWPVLRQIYAKLHEKPILPKKGKF